MTRRTASVLLAVLLFSTLALPAAAAKPTAKTVVAKLDSPRGICAVLGDTRAKLAIAIAKSSELLVYVQLASAKDVEAARRAADAAGLLGTRIYVEQGGYGRVHLADNLADVVAVLESTVDKVADAEVLRVLRPGGKGFVGNRAIVKPAPEGIDDWSHPAHGPDNNPRSDDELARAPYLTQFMAEPWYCPIPSLAVASGGRIFRAFGDRAFKRPQWPWINTLLAMNGYNGTILWKRKLAPDFMIQRNTLIATPDTLYLGDNVSCKLIDAATGELKSEIKVPEGISDGPVWKWMGIEGGVLYALVGEREPRGETLKGKAFRGA
ncbi:MAG: hypothetical protein QGD94_10805, partial [Planctomycetia bacterium]|nr:hypothetical protein [Planctomycetia bacterium]